ncbi:MAG TPA: hypothetical protein VKR61_15630, partial [Bryobacteraceae bacterium]|nr:hypothetical protein [Bryobacteraceae bacterium]
MRKPLLWLLCAGAAWAQSAPSINPGGAVNAAGYTAPLAPGSIAAVYGSFLLSSPAEASGAPLPKSLEGLSLQFSPNLAAPLFFASAGQVNLQVPWETTGQSAVSLTATLNGQAGAPQAVSIAPFAPGIFSANSQGTGQGAILNTSYQLVDASHPAIPGVTYVQIYCTGLGAVSHQPATGAASPVSPLAETPTMPEVTIGGVPATVIFSGLAPGFVGEYQVNAQVPAAAPAGSAVPVTMSIGGATSNTVTIAVGPPVAVTSSLAPAGGIALNNAVVPLVYSWNSPIQFQGSGWKPGEIVTATLHGPLNWQAVPPADLGLGTLTADASGNLAGTITIPYDTGVTGPSTRIPRPGIYEVNATGSISGTVAATATITICVATELGAGFQIDWGHERGGRLGVFPGTLADFSPERVDPEWVTVWRQAPVQAYGTIMANTNGIPPARITSSDYPGTHYGHDANLFLTPDPEYQWLVGTRNYYANALYANNAGPGVIEIEWETLNAGSPASYGQGNIGLPVWANPTTGDRVFVVGRWILDAGHPDKGDSTEIHPPRLLATMRTRPAAAPGSGARATQVDIYASGHGGGANQIDPPGLSDELDQNGYGGGRIQDALDASDQQVYYQAGPASALVAALANTLAEKMVGSPLTGQIFTTAGPSAFPWGAPGTEEMPINDMDYDFDVPLPPPPAGATSIQMYAATHPQHTTAVNEVVTYTNPVNGLPTVAH